MKKILVLLVIGLFLNVTFVSGQTTKGNSQLGLSTTLNLAGMGSDLIGFGATSVKYKSNASGYTEPDPDKQMSFNLAPKFGYFIMDNLAVGAELNFAYRSEKDGTDDDKYSTTLFGAGPFVRYYFPAGKVFPYAEANSFFGSMKSKYDPSEGTGDEDKSGITAFGGGLGVAIPMGEKVSFDLMAGYNSFTIKDKEDNPDDERVVLGTFGIKLGITIFLGSN